jgi:hypothetical protein
MVFGFSIMSVVSSDQAPKGKANVVYIIVCIVFGIMTFLPFISAGILIKNLKVLEKPEVRS